MSTVQIPEGRVYTRIISQLILTAKGPDIFRELQERVLKWAFDPKRNVTGIPDGAWEGDTFEIDTDRSEYAAAVRLIEPKYWAFRCRQSLWDLENRIWTTEVGLAERSGDNVIFGCRLLCSQKGPQPGPRSIPTFVRGIAFTQDVSLDERSTSPDPWLIADEPSVDKLVAFLLSSTRRHPVVVFSLPDGSEEPKKTALPVWNFVRRTVGYVHSVVITSAASFFLTDRVGREFSVYRQAIRTYNPGFDPNIDLSSEHPVASFAFVERLGTASLDFLVDQTLRPILPRAELEELHPSFDRIKQMHVDARRSQARREQQDSEELLRLSDEETQVERDEARTTMNLLSIAEQERDDEKTYADQLKAENYRLRIRIQDLEGRLRESGGDQDTGVPDSLDRFRAWCDANLAGTVLLHSRAFKGVDNSEYRDVDLIYKSLLLLRDYYVPMRRKRDRSLVDAYERECRVLGVEETESISDQNEGRVARDAYRVSFGLGRRKRKLDRHLKKGTGRDPRDCFRLYFFWDEDEEQIVVGWLPSHLPTPIT